MAYAFVQQAQFSRNSGSETSVASGAFGASLTAGNLMVAHVWYGKAGAAITVTLSGAGSPTWVEESVVSASDFHLHSFYALNVPGGTTAQLSASFTSVQFPSIYVAEYSGFKTTSARLAGTGQNQATPGTSTDAVTSGLLGTLSEQPAGIVAFSINEASASTPAAGTSFSALTAVWDYEGSATLSGRPEHRRVTATTSVAGTFTSTTNQRHKTWAWAFAETVETPISDQPETLHVIRSGIRLR